MRSSYYKIITSKHHKIVDHIYDISWSCCILWSYQNVLSVYKIVSTYNWWESIVSPGLQGWDWGRGSATGMRSEIVKNRNYFFLFYSQLTWFRFFIPFHLLLLLESDMVFQEVQPWGQPGEGALQTNLYLFLRSKTQRQISINQPNMICWLSLDGKLVWTSLGTTWIEGEIMEFFWTFYQEFH